jgi:hypothetical protein
MRHLRILKEIDKREAIAVDEEGGCREPKTIFPRRYGQNLDWEEVHEPGRRCLSHHEHKPGAKAMVGGNGLRPRTIERDESKNAAKKPRRGKSFVTTGGLILLA